MSCFLAALSACAANVVQTAHLTTHSTSSTTKFGTDSCSATAIGPHALLTASHCEAPTSVITVDDTEFTIMSIVRDGADHTIYTLSGDAFKDYATISTDELAVSDDVFIFGNPGDMEDILRKGYVCAVGSASYLIDLNGFYGDSGSGLFNTKGKIVGVLSALRQPMQGNVGIKLMIAYKLAFTVEQIKVALESK